MKNYSELALKLETTYNRYKAKYNNCEFKDEEKWDLKVIDCRMKAEQLRSEIRKEYNKCKREHCDICDKEECPTCKPEFDKLRYAISRCNIIVDSDAVYTTDEGDNKNG